MKAHEKHRDTRRLNRTEQIEEELLRTHSAKKFSPKELGGKQTVGSCSQPPLQQRRRAAGNAGAAACATGPSASPPDPETQRLAGSLQTASGGWAPSRDQVNVLEDQSHLNSTFKRTPSKVGLSSR